MPEEEHLKNILPCQRIKQSTAELKEPTIEQQQERRKEYNYNYKCGGEVATNKPPRPPPKAPTTDPNTKTIIIPLRLPQQLKPTELPYLKWASERTIIMREWAGGWWEGGWQENAEGVLIIIIMGFPRTTKPSRTTSETENLNCSHVFFYGRGVASFIFCLLIVRQKEKHMHLAWSKGKFQHLLLPALFCFTAKIIRFQLLLPHPHPHHHYDLQAWPNLVLIVSPS